MAIRASDMSSSLSLLLSMLALSCLLSVCAGQSSSCGFNGLDVSSLSGRTLVGVFSGSPYTVNPCSVVSGVPGIACAGQVCLGNTVLSRYSTAASANITWVAADNGLVQLSQNGDLCGGDGPRQNTLRFVCNAAATTAYISDVEQLTTCHYYVIVQTSFVCTQPTSLKSVGSTYVSDLCGAGAWPLSQLLPEDISFSPDNNVTQVYINPCFTVQSPNCAQAANPTSVCQAYYPLSSSSTDVFQLGVYDPSRTAVQYTLLSNGIVQSADSLSHPSAQSQSLLSSSQPLMTSSARLCVCLCAARSQILPRWRIRTLTSIQSAIDALILARCTAHSTSHSRGSCGAAVDYVMCSVERVSPRYEYHLPVQRRHYNVHRPQLVVRHADSDSHRHERRLLRHHPHTRRLLSFIPAYAMRRCRSEFRIHSRHAADYQHERPPVVCRALLVCDCQLGQRMYKSDVPGRH